MTKLLRNNDRVFVSAAIHLGRSSAYWALAFINNFKNGISRIQQKHWNSRYSILTPETPFCLLVKPDGKTLDCFGYEAEDKYEKLKEDVQHKQYYFFTSIGRTLVEKYKEAEECETEAFITDEVGKQLPALTVFSLALKFFKDDIKMMFHERGKGYKFDFETDVHVILTIPEMFQDVRAIDFLRQAASKAGYNPQTLSVITEIDAVSIYYQHLSSNEAFKDRIAFPCKEGMKYMLVNAGSCSTNIVVHEMMDVGVVKENTVVSIHQGGLSMVWKEFEEFCKTIFSEEAFETFKATSNEDWIDMKRSIEIKIRDLRQTDTSVFRIRVPSDLRTLYLEKNGIRLNDAIAAGKFSGEVTLRTDILKVSPAIFCKFINKAVAQTLSDIHSALKDSDVAGIVIFGQFAELQMVQDEILASVRGIKVMYYPAETWAFLKGSILIGLKLGSVEKIERVQNTAAVVVAIDFGTTYSGLAHSLRSDFEVDRTKAKLRLWHSGSTQTEKTPTCVLIRPDGQTVEAFGYDAENKYRELIDSGKHRDYYFFRHFKMLLSKKLAEKLNRNITVEDEMNRSLPALDVFAMCIRFLKDDFLSAINKRFIGDIRNQDVQWVLTVPAIWTDGSKQFMREAALKAGIEGKRLTIALEPEAASLYCRHLPLEAIVCNNGVNISSFQVGTRYMVLDAGGGTVDVTVHEVDTNNGVKEVHAACGGGWGGTTVDEEFKKLLVSLLTEEVFMQFKMENMEDWLDLCRHFELKKRTITPSANSPLRMRLPQSLTKMLEQVDKCIEKSGFADGINLDNDKIKFSPEIPKSWFGIAVNKTIEIVRDILSKDVNIKAILMVGGFSESPVLQEAVRTTFNDIEVVIPREASSSILKGALIFGHVPKFVTERVLKYTYGISSFDDFVYGKHPENRRFNTDAGVVCRDVFSKHVGINQRVKLGEAQVCHVYSPKFKSQNQLDISIYASKNPNPVYTDQGCTLVGKMSIELADHDGALDREILVALTFSGTEIVVEAKDKKTGCKTYSAIDFLG